MQVIVIGRGKVGRALATALGEAGVEVTLQRGRARLRVVSRGIYLLAVPDAQIAVKAAALQLRRGSVVLHLAGARSTRELQPLHAQGVHVAVFHPLLSFAHAERSPSFDGATFTAFGDPRALAAAKRLARALGARVQVLASEPDARYHAAAALVANGSAALACLGVDIMKTLGFKQRAAERAVAGLLASVAQNVRTVGVPNALTGPVSRGDAGTLAAHLAALARADRTLAAAYTAVQPAIIAAARAQGLPAAQARALERVLAGQKRRI